MALDNVTLQVACSGGLTGNEEWANIWHLRHQTDVAGSVTVGIVEAEAIADGFETFYSAIAAYLNAATELTDIAVSQLDEPGNNYAFSYNTPGTSASGPLPPQDAIVLSMRAVAGANPRRRRGRIFLAGFAENATTGTSPRLVTAAQDDIGNAFTALSNGLQGVGWDIAVLSRVDDLARPIVAMKIGTTFDTQRRRRNKIAEQYVSYPV